MAHEIEIRDGRASFLSVGQTAWHGLGDVLDSAPDLSTAVRVIRADYVVERVPLYTRHMRLVNGEQVPAYKPSRTACATVRTDTGAQLGTVTPKYVPVQNVDAFGALAPLLDAGVAKIEVGGVLRDGASAWLAIQFDVARFGPIVREVFADEVVPFGVARTYHDGLGSNYIATMGIRPVCANTLAAGEQSMTAVKIPHVGDAVARTIDAATEVFGGLVDRMERVAAGYRALRALHLTNDEFASLVLDTIAPRPQDDPKFNPAAKLADMVVQRVDAKRAELFKLWTGGKGHTGDMSAWEAYNGVVECIDHSTTMHPTRSGKAWKTQSLLDGGLARMKAQTFDRLLSAAARSADARVAALGQAGVTALAGKIDVASLALSA